MRPAVVNDGVVRQVVQILLPDAFEDAGVGYVLPGNVQPPELKDLIGTVSDVSTHYRSNRVNGPDYA